METLKHDCGIAIIRLLKPLDYYKRKYGTYLYGLNKLYLLMEKQHNRGQEGAGLGCIKLEAKPGNEYIFRERAQGSGAIQEIFGKVKQDIVANKGEITDAPFVGEVYLGHLRYSSGGKSGISYVHPFLRRNNWRARNLLLCGNFSLTNLNDVFDSIVKLGQHPRMSSENIVLLEQLGYALDNENKRLVEELKEKYEDGIELTKAIEDNINWKNILSDTAKLWDGGYVVCGANGSGDVFTIRDPHGIRPAFYYCDDEICVVASERPVIQTVMNVDIDDVNELMPGNAIIITKNGEVKIDEVLKPESNARCSFERIYFSRGGDKDIYQERKNLGYELVPKILKSIKYDIHNTILSFIPNTAEVAYLGMVEGFEDFLNEEKARKIADLERDDPEYINKLNTILSEKIRNEKIAFKDIKLRTFITAGEARDDLAAHVYDVAYGIVNKGVDNLVVIDDSIVRGTTLRQSIIRILDRLHPKKIVIVSSSPQIRYPDYYGIDMSKMGEFCAFHAAIELLKERGMESLITEVYARCIKQREENKDWVNHVKAIYKPFTAKEISDKIAEMLTPEGTKAEVELVFQSIEGLHKSIPNNPGDWFFTGDFPTLGGVKLINQAYIDYYEQSYKRS